MAVTRSEIPAGEALKHFKTRPTVQTARSVKVEVKDDAGHVVGKRDAYETRDVSCGEEHVLAAAKYSDGRVTIVTIDGKRHETSASFEAEKKTDKKDEK